MKVSVRAKHPAATFVSVVAEPLTAPISSDPEDEPQGDDAPDCIQWQDGDHYFYYGPRRRPSRRPEYPMMWYGPGGGGRGYLDWPYSKLERKAIRKARKKARRVVTWLKLRRFGVPPEGGWPEPEFVSAPAVADAATERERQRKAGA